MWVIIFFIAQFICSESIAHYDTTPDHIAHGQVSEKLPTFMRPGKTNIILFAKIAEERKREKIDRAIS